MLRKLSLLLLSIAAVGASAQQFNVSGTIKGHNGKVFFLTPKSDGSRDTLGTVTATNGAFNFSGKAAQPTTIILRAENTKVSFPVFVESGNYTVVSDVENPNTYSVAGAGKAQAAWNKFHKAESDLAQQRDSARAALSKVYDINTREGRLQANAELKKYSDAYYTIEDDFLSQNDNEAAAYLLAMRRSSFVMDGTLPEKYEMLGQNARKAPFAQWVKPLVDKLQKLTVGNIAPDITLTTPDGESLSIYGVKAKVKVLDFWASWCGPCMAEVPNVKRMYDKYHDAGLEIIGISLDEDKDAWTKAINNKELNWQHMSDLKGWKSAGADAYAVQAIPAVYVLDADNKIIGKNLRGEELEEFVGNALK